MKKANLISATAVFTAMLFLFASCNQAPQKTSDPINGKEKLSAAPGIKIHAVGTIVKTTVTVSMEVDTNNDGKVDNVVEQQYVGQKAGDRLELPSGKLLPTVKKVANALAKKPTPPINLGKAETLGMMFPQTVHIPLNASEATNGLVAFKIGQMNFEVTAALGKKFNQIADSMSGIEPSIDQKTGVIFSIAKDKSNGKYYIKDLWKAPAGTTSDCDMSF